MARPQPAGMTVEEFFAWQQDQDERYELVDGVPVPLRMMTGASHQHDVTVVNMIAALVPQLRGTRCRVATADTAVRTTIKGIRRPDLTVDCAPPQRDVYEARAPKLVAEVLSPSTRQTDRIRKVEEYKRLATVEHILFVEPDLPRVLLLTRGPGGSWTDATYESLDDRVDLPAIGASLAMSGIYEGVPLRG